MKGKLKILTLLLSLFICSIGFGQDSLVLNRIGPNYSKTDNRLKHFFIYDGIPILKKNQIKKILKGDQVDSIFVRKDTIFDLSHKVLYFGVIVVNSKDTVNKGLKGIIKKTNN